MLMKVQALQHLVRTLPYTRCYLHAVLLTRGCVDMSDADAQVMLRGIDFSGYKDFEFEYGQVHVSGGKLGKPLPLITRRARCAGTTFVLCGTNQRWLITATTGVKTGYSKNMFGSKCLVDALHDVVLQACNGDLETTETAMEEEGGGEEEYDPMNEVDCAEVDISPAKKPRQETRGCGDKRARYYKNHAKGRILDIDFPKYPPEIVADCREKRSIQLLIATRQQVWLRLEDVPWAVKYLYIQGVLKGVPLVAADSRGPCAATTPS